MTQEDWITLIQTYKNGEFKILDRKFQSIYNHYRIQLLKKMKSEEDAKDVFVEGMLKFRKKFLLGNDTVKNYGAYFYTILNNTIMDFYRKRNAKTSIKYERLDLVSLQKFQKASAFITDEMHQAEEEEASNYLVALETAIGKLCDKCRGILESKFYEGKKFRDIQKEVGHKASFQAFLKIKDRCIKKLASLFFIELQILDADK